MRPRATLGIVGGNGWLGHALANSVLAAGFVSPSSLTLSCRSAERGAFELAGVHWTRDNKELARRSDVIILSVRPEQFGEVRIDAREKLVISVMAGVRVKTIREHTNSEQVVRAMPNAAAAARMSYTPWFASGEISPETKQWVQTLFETCGTADEAPCEADIDYLTGLTGSGPAYPALLADAMISHAISRGFRPELASRAVRGTLAGAARLLATDASRPADLVRSFIDYRGTTAAALQTMIDGGFCRAVHAGLEAAEAKATEMAAILHGGQ